jgi:hypothetical protein
LRMIRAAQRTKRCEKKSDSRACEPIPLGVWGQFFKRWLLRNNGGKIWLAKMPN